MQQWIRQLGLAAVLAVGSVGLYACGPDKNDTMRDRQDQAMRDPFHYSPDMDRTDVSGGGLGNFNGKALGKDLDDLINP